MSNSTITEIMEAVRADRPRIFEELSQLVSFHSVHGDPTLAEPHAQAAEWVATALNEHGLDIETLETSDGSTAVIGRREARNNAPTVLLYSHYDVVPAGPRENWESDPLILTEREGRWYGRGAADCKGNVVMHLAALRALAAAGDSDVGLIVLVEGSEEDGGLGLENLIEHQPELVQADAIIIADTGNAAVGVPTLTTSLRGGAQITVTMRTLEADAHSGLFGGAAPDAVAALMRTLDSLRDARGRTLIDGVNTYRTWEGTPYEAEDFRRDAGVLEGVELTTDTPADAVWASPAITVTGFTSTPVVEAVNAVPAIASARVNVRVPDGMNPHEVAQKVVEHIEHHTPWGAQVEATIDEVNPTFSTDLTGPAVGLLSECLAQAYGREEVEHLGSGGSIPLTATLKKAVPQAEIMLCGVEEPTCGIHGPRESVDPSEIEAVAIAETLFLLRYPSHS